MPTITVPTITVPVVTLRLASLGERRQNPRWQFWSERTCMRAAQHAVPTSALEVSPARRLRRDIPPELNTDGPDRVTVLVIADGAACHGDNAPGRRDDRSDAFDAALAHALATGDPAALADACRNPELPADAVMASVNPLALLADLTRSAPPDAADLLYSGAPFGVGYFVASWRWNQA